MQKPKAMWEYLGTEITEKHGKAVFNLAKWFNPGLYPLKFLVK